MQNKKSTMPLVSIGIPTYNRAKFLKRSIESTLNQDYENIEVIVSDNASTDETEDVCRFYCEQSSKLKYFRQPANMGATANFAKVLEMASGEFFMWLGDDDWIDNSYIRLCVHQLLLDLTLSLVSGAPRYYHNGLKAFDGKQFNLIYESWWRRVAVYYTKVADNGMFYGVMRTAQIKKINTINTMGGDRIMIAGLSAMGKIKINPEVQVHRELGGATVSYLQIAKSLGLPRIQSVLPITSIATSAWLDIVIKGSAYQLRPVFARLMLGTAVFSLILLKFPLRYFNLVVKFIDKKLNISMRSRV